MRRSKVVRDQGAPKRPTNALGISPLQRRLAELEKEQRTLLKRIARKQTTLDLRRGAAERSDREVFGLVEPLREKALKSATELVAMFDQLLGGESRLDAREKKRVRSVCDDLREWLDLDELFASFEPEAHPPEPGDDPPRNRGRSRRQPPHDETRGPSATKPTGDASAHLTRLFRRLALLLHPDRVQDEREKASCTQRMQELTRAYEQGDLARLLEVERSLGNSESQDRLAAEPLDADAQERRLEHLTAVNRDLLRQLRDLQKLDKQLCADIPGVFDEQGRFHPNAELELFLEELEHEVARLEYVTRFTRRFVLGEIGLREFVKGPEPDADVDLDDHLEELLEAVMLQELIRELDRPGFGPSPRKRRPATRKAKARKKRRRA